MAIDMNTSAESFFPAAPVLVTGVHRSGTSVVARCLKELGVFIGSDLEKNHESMFFQGLSAWVFSLVHAGWDAPSPLTYLYEDERLIVDCATKLHKALQHGSLFREYGKTSGFFSWGGAAIPDCWGWKDPRLMVLLPIWCRIFPSAKWVVVHRNGGDVAASLVERELQGEHRQLQSFPLSVGYEEFISYRCRSLVRAFSVWQEYQMFFEEYRPLIVGRVFELSYESICQQPELELKRLAAFVGVDPNPKTISLLAQDITTHQLARPKSFQEPISAMSTCQHSKRLGYVD